ncbi:MAG: hypothetical protein M5U12_09110 [Verrucomicrobia bacterium]|nr:hypothetical protein [Verrucomicrobiota bacterium]
MQAECHPVALASFARYATLANGWPGERLRRPGPTATHDPKPCHASHLRPTGRSTPSRTLLALGFIALLQTAPPPVQAHPDRIEDRLLLHFATGVHAFENGTWSDLTHTFKAQIQGEPRLATLGPAQVVVFNGFTDWLLVAPDRATAQPRVARPRVLGHCLGRGERNPPRRWPPRLRPGQR